MKAGREGIPRVGPMAAAAALGLLVCFVPAAAHAQIGPPANPISSECVAQAQGWLEPGLVLAGEPVYVATRVTFSCPARRHAYHLVVAVDRTTLTPGGRESEGIVRLAGLLSAVALPQNPDMRIGLVAYDDRAELVCSLTNSADRLSECLDGLRAPDQARLGGEALGDAIVEARKAIMFGRAIPGATSPIARREAILVLAWPPSPAALASAAEAARAVESKGIEVETVDLSDGHGSDWLAGVASPHRAHALDDWPSVVAEQEYLAWATRLRIRSGSVHEFLNRTVVPDLDSADPAYPGYDRDRHNLEWLLQLDGQESIHLSYSAVSLTPGRQPLRTIGFGVFRDTYGLRGTFTLPEPEIVVADGRIVQVFMPAVRRIDSSDIKTVVSRD